jgi:hypothetical protein
MINALVGPALAAGYTLRCRIAAYSRPRGLWSARLTLHDALAIQY